MKLPRTLAIAAISAVVLFFAIPGLAQQGVTADTITLGHSGPSTGPLAELGKEYLSGAILYFDQINANGGIHGRRIRIAALDDAYDPERAAENARRLIDEQQAFALFGCFGTGPSLKIIPIASAAKIPFFAPYTGADALREPLNPYVFHVRASYRQEIEKIVEHLAKLGVRAIVVVHHTDPFGQAGLDAATSALTRHGLTPAAAIPISSSGSDAAEAVSKITAVHPAAVIMITAGNSSVALLRALRQTDQQPMLYGLSVIGSRQIISELGENAHGLAIAQVVPSPFRLDYPIVRNYRRAADKTAQPYSYPALEGYLTAHAFAEALRRAGRDLDRDRLRSALESLNGWDAGGLRFNFSSRRHDALDYVDLTVISHGRFAN